MKFKFVTLLILFSGLFFVSCSDGDGDGGNNPVNGDKEDMYAVWERIYSGSSGTFKIELTISEDKTLFFDYESLDSTDFYCDYTKNGNILTLTNYPGCDEEAEYGLSFLEKDKFYLYFTAKTDPCEQRVELLEGQWTYLKEAEEVK